MKQMIVAALVGAGTALLLSHVSFIPTAFAQEAGRTSECRSFGHSDPSRFNMGVNQLLSEGWTVKGYSVGTPTTHYVLMCK